ncbi:MAG: M3 family oligoendopeptidase [Phycisphaerales bacterium]|nr:M3 family oligoendopeptidase [Phycisphaerales bacterium]
MRTTINMNTPACSSPSASFVPQDLDATRWENLGPLYQALLERPLKCPGCLEGLLLDRSELDAAANEAHATLYINMTRHTDDEAVKRAYLSFVENVEPELKKIGFEIDKKIAGSEHAAKLDQKRYGVLLRNLKADVEIFRPENIPLQTEETKLATQYEEICGAMTVVFRGEEKTLPQMGKYLEVTDRATREEAWRLIAERRYQDHQKLNDIFAHMVKLRHQMARNAGFENYLEYTFKRKHRFDYTPAHCEAFHRGAEEVCVPVYRQLNAERAKALKVDRLRPWDLGVDIKGRAPLRPFEKADDLIEKTSRVFHRMDSSLGKMFDSMRPPEVPEGDCLDLDSRKGKAPGGYQQMRDRQRKPFIFMNAAGLQRDLETMVHEAGHAFHSMLCKEEPLVDYRHSPLEFAEVASMSMELLTYPYLGEFYSEQDASRAKRTHLEDLAKMIPWIATIDAFQHWIYKNPNHTRAQRTTQWLELDAGFGAAVDWTGLEKYREVVWQRQLHLFCVPLYYIEYGIAQLGALQLWLQARRDQKRALENYRKALMLGGSRPLPELFGAAGLKFEFGPGTMRGLMDEVQGELRKLPA